MTTEILQQHFVVLFASDVLPPELSSIGKPSLLFQIDASMRYNLEFAKNRDSLAFIQCY